MIREDEIIKFADREHKSIAQETDYTNTAAYEGIIAGAKWADKNPYQTEEEKVGMGKLGAMWQKEALINKACEWLKTNTNWANDYEWDGKNPDFGKIDDFRKAMEE